MARTSSTGADTSSQTISARGIIIEPMARSSRRNTLRTIWCSCASMTPASRPSSRLAAISSSVTRRDGPPRMPNSLSVASVAHDSTLTNGRAASESHSIGVATVRATVSGKSWPSRLGTSSPKMMVRKVMLATTIAVALTPAAAGLSPTVLQPLGERLRERRLADDAVEHADRGDADLHRGEELGRVVVQVERHLRLPVARLDHDLQPRLARRRERHLGHGEHAVEQDEKYEQCDVHAGRAGRRAGNAVSSAVKAGQRSRIAR